MNNKKALIIKNLTFRFNKNSVPFFENINIDFDAGKIHFIKGKNGIGKSVFFRILQGNICNTEYYSGDIYIDHVGLDQASQNEICLDRSYIKQSLIRLVNQKFDQMLADKFSFKQNLQFANFGQVPLFSKLTKHKPLPEFLNKFNIDFEKPVFKLSGGQRQILAILMALQKQCKILLLDEPTSALDEQNANTVMEFVSELVTQTGITALIISHDNELVERHAKNGFYEITVNPQTQTRRITYKLLN